MSEAGEIRQDPELVLSDQVTNLPRSFEGVFIIKQFLPTEIHSDLSSWFDQEVSFIFDDIWLEVKLHSPYENRTETKELRMPATWDVKLPPIPGG